MNQNNKPNFNFNHTDDIEHSSTQHKKHVKARQTNRGGYLVINFGGTVRLGKAGNH